MEERVQRLCGGPHCAAADPLGNRVSTLVRLAAREPNTVARTELALLAAAMAERKPVTGLIPAGYTYLGQFIDHDLSFVPRAIPDPERPIPEGFEPFSTRSPRLDLDSLYGTSADLPVTPSTPVLLQIGNSSGVKAMHDLPRDGMGKAEIPDERNDENLLVAQLHLVFLKFHQRIAEDLARTTSLEPHLLFQQARATTTAAYQYVVEHDFLYELCDPEIFRTDWSAPAIRAIFRPGEVSVEFVGAAFRFGHAMVRNSYLLRDQLEVNLAELLQLTGRHFEPGIRSIPATHTPDWGTLFFDSFGSMPQSANAVNIALARDLKNLFVEDGLHNLAALNLFRGAHWELASGQSLARAICARLSSAGGDPALIERLQPLPTETIERISPDTWWLRNNRLLEHLPLWYYFLLEAPASQPKSNGGLNGRGGLGPLASFIVAGTLKAALAHGKNPANAAAQIRQSPQLGGFLSKRDAFLAGQHARKLQLFSGPGIGHGNNPARPKWFSMIDIIEYALHADRNF